MLKNGDKVIVFSIYENKNVEGVIIGQEPNGSYYVDTREYIFVRREEDLTKC